MKRYILLGFSLLSFVQINAQDINDALQFSQDNLNGTARFRGMSGAFGALGGDFSAITVNPAGSTVFANSQIGLSLTNFNVRNKTDYFNTSFNSTANKLALNQMGLTLVLKDTAQSNWRKLSVGLYYEVTNRFESNNRAIGTNPTTSIAQYFVNQANGVELKNIRLNGSQTTSDLYSYLGESNTYSAQQAFLGNQAQVIIPDNKDDNNNTKYNSNVPTGGNYYQDKIINSTGYSGKVSANIAGEFRDRISIGLNLNSHFTEYNRTYSLYEENQYKNMNGLNWVEYNTNISTIGNGFSFQLGTLIKATKALRLGLAYESSTWYLMNDELTQSISSGGNNSNGNFNTNINPNVVNIYAPYRIQTPSKGTFSAAYIFGRKGLLSIDYSLKDYTTTRLKPTNDDYFRAQNLIIENSLQTAQELRIGAEYRYGNASFRGGFRYEESPYKTGLSNIGSLHGYSVGYGYNFGGTRLDFSYSLAKRNYATQMLNTGLTDTYYTSTILQNVTATLIFEL